MFRSLAAEGKHVILSSHVLQEVDLISDQVVLIANGMIAVSLTFRGDWLPTVVVENLHEAELLVAVEDGNAHRLYHGFVDQS